MGATSLGGNRSNAGVALSFDLLDGRNHRQGELISSSAVLLAEHWQPIIENCLHQLTPSPCGRLERVINEVLKDVEPGVTIQFNQMDITDLRSDAEFFQRIL